MCFTGNIVLTVRSVYFLEITDVMKKAYDVRGRPVIVSIHFWEFWCEINGMNVDIRG